MTENKNVIRRRPEARPAALPEGMVLVEVENLAVSPRTEILREILARRFNWRRECLGMGLPTRR
jgi:hypothetical protein